jgi:fibronectin-binding autotransporter adhesin
MLRIRTWVVALVFVVIAAGRGSAGDNAWTNAANNLTWNTTSADWTSPTVWNNSNVDSAIFSSTGAAAITVAGPITLRGMKFTANGYTLAGSSALTLTNGGGGTLGVGEVQVSSGVSAAVNAPIGGSVGLNKTGAGTLALGGTNTYSGGTTVSAGAVAISADGNLGAAAAGLTLNGGTLVFTGTGIVTALSGSRAVTLGASGGTIDTSSLGAATGNVTTVASVIGGSGGLTLAAHGDTSDSGGGSGSNLILTGANTFTGPVSINSGVVDASSNFGNAANGITINGGGLVATFNPVTVARNITLAGSGDRIFRVYGSGGTMTVTGNISGPGSLRKTDLGTLIVTGSNSYTGGTTIAGGTLQLGNSGALPSGGPVTITNGTLDLSGFNQTIGALTLGPATSSPPTVSAGTGILTLAGNVTFDAGNAHAGLGAALGGRIDLGGGLRTFFVTNFTNSSSYELVSSAVISGTGGLTWFAPNGGFLALTAANTFSGPTLITGVNSSEVFVATTNALPITTDVTVYGRLSLNPYATAQGVTVGNYDQTVASLAGSGAVSLGLATLTVNGSTSTTFSGVIQDTGSLVKNGTSILSLTGANTYTGTTTISGGTLQVGAGGTTGSIPGNVTDNANLAFNRTDSVSFSGLVSGTGSLTKTGPGTLVLTNAGNSYSGGTTVSQGTLSVAADNMLGQTFAPVTVGPLGTLNFSASASTARTYMLNSGTLQSGAGTTLTLNGATVGGGFLKGSFALTGGTSLSGTSTFNSTVVSQTGAASYNAFSNSGLLSVAANQTATMTGFVNQGSGTVAMAAGSTVNAADFQTYGTVTLSPGPSTSSPTQLTNVGTSPLSFNGGSRTFVSDVAHIGGPAYVDLHGQDAVVAGGLFINHGAVFDSLGSPSNHHNLIADYGATIKGAGAFQFTPVTQNGGKFSPGNSPGAASFGEFKVGIGGISNYVFQIDDATGTAGPSPDSQGHVSGWGLAKAVLQVGPVPTSGDFVWGADSAHPLSVAIDTLVNPTTVGTDVAGPMANFDPSLPYSWTAVEWTGSYNRPTNAAVLDASTAFDTSGVVNAFSGSFGWNFGPDGHSLDLTYTPVPEPGTLLLVGAAAGGFAACWRRRLTVV